QRLYVSTEPETYVSPVSAVQFTHRQHHLNPKPFIFHDTPPTQIYTLSLHDALPISPHAVLSFPLAQNHPPQGWPLFSHQVFLPRSEEHTSELQSRGHLVCRLLLEKKKKS